MALMRKEGVAVFFLIESAIILLVALVGNIILLLFSYERRPQCDKLQKLLIRNLALANLMAALLAIPSNIAYISYEYKNDATNSSIACILRYFSTFSTSSASLMFLTALCIHKKDKVSRIPLGLIASIRRDNVGILSISIWLFSFLPTAVGAIAYTCMFIYKKESPCCATEKNRISFYIGLAKGAFIAIIFATSITLIIRAALKIKSVVRRCRKSPHDFSLNRQITNLRRTNAIFHYTAIFIFMWAPLSVIAIFAADLPSGGYSFAFTLGYEFAHISVAILPVFHSLTDSNFKLFVKERMRGSRSNRVSFEAFFVNNPVTKQ